MQSLFWKWYFPSIIININDYNNGHVFFFLTQEQKICQRYDQLMEAWEKKVERMENNPRRKAKESRTREYYERQFPEIRKQREQQERFQRYHELYPSLVNIILLLTHYKTPHAFLCRSFSPHTCSKVRVFPTLMGFAVYASVDCCLLGSATS